MIFAEKKIYLLKEYKKPQRNKTECITIYTEKLLTMELFPSFPSFDLRLLPDVPVYNRVSDFEFGVSPKGEGRA